MLTNFVETKNEGNIRYLSTLQRLQSLQNEKLKLCARVFAEHLLCAERLHIFAFTVSIPFTMQLFCRERGLSMGTPFEIWGDEWNAFAVEEVRKSAVASEETKLGLNALLESVESRAWTALENVARDSWETAVNESDSLGKAVFHAVDADTRQARITAEALSKHDFDIRGKLGSLLLPGGFSSVDGIKRAFEFISPKDAQLASTLGQPDLRSLEQRRHLVQHRCGIVDAKFQMSYPEMVLGERLWLKDSDVESAMSLVADVGWELLKRADSAIQKTPTLAKH